MMDDSPEQLRDLARTAREEEAEERQRWDRWDRLTDGDLSPQEEAELKALAATSPEDMMAFEAFRPLDEDFRARMAEMFGQMVPGPPRPIPEPVDPPFWEKCLRAVREGFSWRPWRFVGPGLLAGAAALYLIPPRVPGILVEVLAVSVSRGEGAPFVPGGRFKADIWPEKEFSRRLAPSCYLEMTEGSAEKIRSIECAASQHSDTAWMSIEGRLPEKLPIGSATLWVVLAYPDHQPDADTVGKLDKPTQSRWHGWSAQPTPIEIRAP